MYPATGSGFGFQSTWSVSALVIPGSNDIPSARQSIRRRPERIAIVIRIFHWERLREVASPMLSRCKIFSTRTPRSKHRQIQAPLADAHPTGCRQSGGGRKECVPHGSLRCGVFVCLKGRIVRVWTLVGRPTESVCRPTRQSALCSGSCQKAGQSSASPSFDLT